MDSIEKYKIDEMIYDPELYDLLNNDDSDVNFYKERVSSSGSKDVLELCCGSGRILIPLARLGFHMFGVDRLHNMILATKKKAESEELSVSLFEDDIKTLNLKRKFDHIILGHNALQDFYTRNDILKVLQTITRHLSHEGLLYISIFNPNLRFIVSQEGKKRTLGRFFTKKNESIDIYETHIYANIDQMMRLSIEYIFDSGKQIVQKLDLRVYFPQEILALLSMAGLKPIEILGDYSGKPLEGSSPNQIFICKKSKD